MSSPPKDLEPDELELYARFGALRQELQTLVVELADVVLTRIELFEDQDERARPPQVAQVVSSTLTQLINLLTSWRQEPARSPHARVDSPQAQAQAQAKPEHEPEHEPGREPEHKLDPEDGLEPDATPTSSSPEDDPR